MSSEHDREVAEHTLGKGEAFSRSLLQHVLDVVAVLDADGTLLYINSAVETMLGYAPEEVIGTTVFDYVHPDDVERAVGALAETLVTSGVLPPIEFRVCRADGTWRHVEVERNNRLDDPGVGGVVIIVRDVTERKKAEEALKESGERYRAVMEQSVEAIYLYDAETKLILESNDAFMKMMGYSEEELLGMRIYDFIDHDRDNIDQHVRRSLKEKRRHIGERRYRRKDGSVILVDTSASVISYGGRMALCAVSRDVTERKEAEEQKARQARHAALRADVSAILAGGGTLHSILQRCTECMVLHLEAAFARIWTLDEEEKVLELQASAGIYTHLDGVHSRVPVGEYKIGLIAEERLPHLTNDVKDDPRISDKEWAEGEGMVAFAGYPLIVENRVVGVMAMFARQPLEEDTIEALASVADVIAQGIKRKVAEERLEHQALHDSLTNLPNRQLLADRLRQSLDRTRRRRGRKVGVLFMDLDRFKILNDSLGHDAGDRLLVAVAERLKGCLRPGDTLARFGGDEFIVLIEEAEGADDALRVTQRIIEEFRRPFVLDEWELVVRFSIGVALGEAYTKSPDELLREADAAMYRAKDEAADYRMFDPQMHEHALSRMKLENDLRRALEKEEFRIHYQPKVRLGQQDRVEGVEALVRWEHPERGFMLPEEFIPIAEETGLIIPIGGWVTKEACRQAREWQERYPSEPPLAVCVNLSAAQVRHPGLLQDVGAALKESGLEPGSLILEITEGTLLKDTRVIKTVFEELKALGVNLEIDDFGKEYSSLSYLNRLPVDGLKIDRLFLESFGENPSNITIVEAVVSLAHSLGLTVTGEGVESVEQLELLRRMGCDFAQGCHLARPLPPDAASDSLNSTHQSSVHRDDADSLFDSL